MKGVYAAVCERPQAREVSNQRATWKLYICIYILALRLLTVCLRINWGHEPMTGQSNKALLSTERHCTVILITLFQRCIAFVNHTAIDYLHISPSLLSLSLKRRSLAEIRSSCVARPEMDHRQRNKSTSPMSWRPVSPADQLATPTPKRFSTNHGPGRPANSCARS